MSDLKGTNTEGLLTDIHEDSGYNRWDLILTVIETICTDVNNCIQDDDKDYLYALIQLIDSCNHDRLMNFLPEEGTPYDPDLCKELGKYRLIYDSGEENSNSVNNPLSITVGEFLQKVGKIPKEPGVLNKPSSYPTVLENDNYFMANHYPEDYTIPQAINNALVQAMWWAKINTEESVYKQAALVYLQHVPHAILEGHEMGHGMNPVARLENGLKTQILYILSNLQGWRGEDARHCKKVLKAFATNK